MAKRVYFAFDYEDVADFRANVVRNHNLTKGGQEAGYYDASIWEEAKKKGDLALKRLINGELDYTSVTAVLIGTGTWARRWVRYEIMKSIERRNSVLGIHINSIKDKNSQVKTLGPNPLDNLGVQVSDDGKKWRPYEWKDGKWVWYSDLDPFDIREIGGLSNLKPGNSFTLARIYRTYNWVSDDGYENFSSWIE